MKPISKYFKKNSVPSKFLNIENSLFQEFISRDFIEIISNKLSDKSIYYSFSTQKPNKALFKDYSDNSKLYLKMYFLSSSIAKTQSQLSDLKQSFTNLGVDISNVGGKAKSSGNYLTIIYYEESQKLVVTFGELYLNLYSFTFEEYKPRYTFSVKDENFIKIKRFNTWTSLTINTFLTMVYNEFEGKISHTILVEFLCRFIKLNNNNEFFTTEFDFSKISHGNDLPKISLKEFRKISNKKDLIKRIFNLESVPKQLLHFNFNELSFLYKNLQVAKISDWQKLIIFYDNCREKDDISNDFYSNDFGFYLDDDNPFQEMVPFKNYQLLLYYYRLTFINNGSISNVKVSQANIIIKDYINMCNQLSLKVNLKMTSYKKLIQEHDRLALELIERNIEHREIRIKEVYKSVSFLSLITTTTDLVLEAKRQHHCVAAYLNLIENGSCAIFTDIFEDKRYTTQISYNSKSKSYILNQCKGIFNSEPPLPYKKMLKATLQELNNKIVLTA